MKYLLLVLCVLAAGFSTASAHVVVKPASVGVASFQTFDTSVPSEKDIPTISLRLIIPSGLSYVTPTVKPGWKIDIKKDGDAVKEITWSGGVIPSEQRDDFTFSAQVPASATTLAWKAYQTYSNGQVVSWDQTPDPKKADDDSLTPYSKTTVVDDLVSPMPVATSSKSSNMLALGLSGIALVVSIVSLLRRK